MMGDRAYILQTSSYVPDRVVANEDFSQFPKSALPLIEQKTGVKTRRFAGEGQFTSDLAAQAAGCCLAKAGFAAASLEALILATSSPDRPQPATATRVQALVAAQRAFAFDINSVCSGALFGLYLADSMIRSGSCSSVMVLAAEVYSRITNPKDFSTHPYFGDGAGAALLTASRSRLKLVDVILRSDGAGADHIQVPAGGSMKPFSQAEAKECYFAMHGREVFEFAVTEGSKITNELLARNEVTLDQVSAVICHQANVNILNTIAERTKIPVSKFVMNLDRLGNTAAASVLIALDEYLRTVSAPAGAFIVLTTFGGGLSWGSALIEVCG